MKTLSRATIAGAVGAVTTNLLHEVVRRALPDAPRVDLLGMQAVAKIVRSAGGTPPVGRRLYAVTLASDLVSNGMFFALAAAGPARFPVTSATLLGIAAGAGAVMLPRPLGLTPSTTARKPATRVLTCALYGAGGLATGFVLRATRPDGGSNA